MKYRVQREDNTLAYLLMPFLFIFGNKANQWLVQCKKNWWSRWKTIERYDNKENAYATWLDYETNGKCILPLKQLFTHNKNNNKEVMCELVMNKYDNIQSKEYTYVAGYKPHNYNKFYYGSYSHKSFEDAISKLWGDMEIQKLLKSSKGKGKPKFNN